LTGGSRGLSREGVTSLLLQQLRDPSGLRDTRTFDSVRERAFTELAGRTVWCMGGAPARRLRDRLVRGGGGGMSAAWLEVLDDGAEPPADVRPDDIVVLHHPLTAARAEAIRQQGAHALWHVLEPREPAPAIDAYLMTGRSADGAQLVAALMPGAGVVMAKEIRGATYRDVGWSSLLADVVRTDRGECVGGTLHARPAVAPR
jgi:hypothetical protein